MGKSEAIAVVSYGAMFPGRGTTQGFWQDIFEGIDTFSDVPTSHWLPEDYFDENKTAPDKTYGKRGGFIKPQAFNPIEYGLPPDALDSTDSSQLLALMTASEVVKDLDRQTKSGLDREKTSVVLGIASATEMTAHMAGRLSRPSWIKGMREAGIHEDQVQIASEKIAENFVPWKESTFPGLLGNVVAGRIANRLNLGGVNYVTDAACASSLAAVQVALHELRNGISDTVLAGGADTLNDILMFMCFSKTPALSPTGDCRPFSQKADGTMLGEGIGIIALRRLRDAERDGNTIHAVIRGLGGASDGAGTAIYAPLESGQARALGRAYDEAGYGPETVGLVEAHGTGTIAGDKTELGGLHAVFAPDGYTGAPYCAVGSVKSQIGHTKAAAGSASLIKVIGALSRKVLPPTLKVEEPAEPLKANTPFYINTEARPWIQNGPHPRRASVSSFGFGGSNFHCALEEYTGPNAVKPVRVNPCELFLFSAHDKAALIDQIKNTAMDASNPVEFVRQAERSAKAFDSKHDVRASIVANTFEDLQSKLKKLLNGIEGAGALDYPPNMGISFSDSPGNTGKVAFLFAGQGSQYLGMGRDLAMAYPRAREVWENAARSDSFADKQLHTLCFPPKAFSSEQAANQEAELRAVNNAQPAIGACALAQLAVLDQVGFKADMVAGHSFGEVMALHYAGVLDADAALSVAMLRGNAMSEAAASADGTMAAIKASVEQVADLIAHLAPDVIIANQNGPNQTVISGTYEGVEAALTVLNAAGFKTSKLNVGTGFHSSLVAPAVDSFSNAISQVRFKNARLPVISNAGGDLYPKTGGAIAKALAKQIALPVDFQATVENLYEDGARIFVEIGPGAVLSGLTRDILHNVGDPINIVSVDIRKQNDVFAMCNALGQLGVAGVPIAFENLYSDNPVPAALPPEPKYSIEISGANYGKPYPPIDGADALPMPNFNTLLPSLPTNTESKEYEPMSSSRPTPAMSPNIGSDLTQIAQAHQMYVQALSQAHTAFLNAITSYNGAAELAQIQTGISGNDSFHSAPSINGAMGNPVLSAHNPEPSVQVVPAAPNGAQSAELSAMTAAKMPTPPPRSAPLPAASPIDANTRSASTLVAEPLSASAVETATSPSVVATDYIGLVTEIVAEKTGYPSEMLEANMDLEGELGIDSIKQVEILSTLRERVPDLPEIEPDKLTQLRTITLISDFLAGTDHANSKLNGAAMAAPGVPASHQSADQAKSAKSLSQEAGAGPSTDVVRGLIAEKTGYPADMLEDDMDLEGELGIDSIKQVEILSALRAKYPELPEIQPEDMGQLRTIRAICDFF